MKTNSLCRFLLGLLGWASLAVLPAVAQPLTNSLVADFEIKVNNATSRWSYGTIALPTTAPFVMKLLNTNTKTMASIFSSDTALPVWGSTETAWAYWMLSKNTGTNAIHNLWGDTFDWQPGTVMLYPGQEGRNLLVSWLAPRDMVVGANWTFTRLSARRSGSPYPDGAGTDYRVTLRGSAGDATVVDFSGEARPGGTLYDSHTSSFGGLSVHAGDRLFWEIAGFNNTVDVDATGAAIEITEVVFTGPPVITDQPSGGTVAEGCNFTFTVGASNTARYAWYKNGALIPGAVSAASYSVIDAVTNDAGSYTVVLSNASISMTSAPAVLAVTARPVYATVLRSEDFSNYLGTQNGLQFQTQLKVSNRGDLTGWTKGGTNAVQAVDRTGAGDYAPMIYDDNGLTFSSGIAANELGKTYHIDFVAGPAADANPASATTASDGMVIDVLRGDASVLAAYTCQPGAWAGAQSFAPYSFVYVGDGNGNVRLRISALAPGWGYFGGAIDHLRVATDYVPAVPPQITMHPSGGTVMEWTNFTFSVQATGMPAYLWNKGGIPIPGATNSSYPIINVRTNDAGAYTVVLKNSAGSVTSAPAILNVTPVRYSGSLAADFDINANGSSSRWAYGTLAVPASTPFVMQLLDSNTKTMVDIFGSDTALPVWGSTEKSWAYWMLGKNTEATAIHILWGETLDWQPGTVMLYPGQEGRNLLVSWQAPGDMVINATWTFTRISARAPDSQWPPGVGTDYRVTLRGRAGDTTVVDFAGVARPGGTLYDRHTSSFSGLLVHAGDRLFWEIAGHGGTVDMAATGAAIEIAETVTVSPPQITVQPLGGTVAEGCNFTFNATANGATGASWYRNGNPISGANSTTYPVIDAKISDGATYTLVLTNAGGSVTSTPAVLTVTARPTYATTIFADNFDAYGAIPSARRQYQTGLRLSAGGNLPGWDAAGAGAIRAVDRTGGGDFAAMIWQDNVLTLTNAIWANETGVAYHVDFIAGPSISENGATGTAQSDGMVISVLRVTDSSSITNFTCIPGAWVGGENFAPFSFSYVGDGSGKVWLSISALDPAAGHFGAEIDNLRVATDYVPPSLGIRLQPGTVIVSWPSSPAGYLLQSAGMVTGPYMDYLGSANPQGPNVVATVPLGTTNTFFRLHKP